MHLYIKVYIYANAFMKRASAIKVVLSCTRSAGNPTKKKNQIFFLSEIRNFNIGGPVNQLIIKRPKQELFTQLKCIHLRFRLSASTRAKELSFRWGTDHGTTHYTSISGGDIKNIELRAERQLGHY
jgi:hypothetical protein